MEITTYNFFKAGSRYEYVKDGKQYVFSAEMFECMKRQYLLMGYKIFWETDCFITFTKVRENIENFCARLQKKA